MARSITLPSITDLQFLVLGVLSRSEMYGENLRRELSKVNSVKLAAFYRLLLRMEDDGLVVGRHESIDGHSQKAYAITDKGQDAFEQKIRFVEQVYLESVSR